MTQKETAKWSVYFETMMKHYRDLVWQSNEKSGTVRLREWTEKRDQLRKLQKRKITEKEKSMTSTQYNYENESSMTQKEKLVVHMKTIEKRYRDLA